MLKIQINLYSIIIFNLFLFFCGSILLIFASVKIICCGLSYLPVKIYTFLLNVPFAAWIWNCYPESKFLYDYITCPLVVISILLLLIGAFFAWRARRNLKEIYDVASSIRKKKIIKKYDSI